MTLWGCLLLLVPCAAIPPTVTLRNGVKMPLIAAGSWQYNDTQAEASIAAALEVGFTMIDTAYGYYNQKGVGRALNAHFAKGTPRDQIFVETKVLGCGMGPPASNPFQCYSSTMEMLKNNTEELNLPYVDLVITHFPPAQTFLLRSCGNWNGACQEIREQWRAMTEFYKAGKAKAIGVSNYCPSCMDCLKDAEVPPMVNQMMYSMGMGEDPDGRMTSDKKRGVVTQAYSALGNTPWAKHANPDIISGNLTTRIAKKHNVSTVQVALKYIVSQGIPAVTKSSNPKHLASDLDLWSWDLDDDDKKALNAKRYPLIKHMTSYACNFMETIV